MLHGNINHLTIFTSKQIMVKKNTESKNSRVVTNLCIRNKLIVVNKKHSEIH